MQHDIGLAVGFLSAGLIAVMLARDFVMPILYAKGIL